MASGRAHDRATRLLALPFGLVWWPWLGWAGAVTAATAFLVGGLLLSPDLDTHSNALSRWGPLRLMWWPYRRLVVHRSVLSHSPLLGMAGRLLYLATVVLALGLVAQPLGAPTPSQLLAALQQLWRQQQPLLITALVGLEASSWLHLIQDGDPTPRRPRWLRRLPFRRQRRRPRR